MATASFPFTKSLCSKITSGPVTGSANLLLVDINRDIRAHFSAEGTAGALFLRRYRRRSESLKVDLFTELNQFARTGNGAEATPFAPKLIDFYSRHVSVSLIIFRGCDSFGVLKLTDMVIASQYF